MSGEKAERRQSERSGTIFLNVVLHPLHINILILVIDLIECIKLYLNVSPLRRA